MVRQHFSKCNRHAVEVTPSYQSTVPSVHELDTLERQGGSNDTHEECVADPTVVVEPNFFECCDQQKKEEYEAADLEGKKLGSSFAEIALRAPRDCDFLVERDYGGVEYGRALQLFEVMVVYEHSGIALTVRWWER